MAIQSSSLLGSSLPRLSSDLTFPASRALNAPVLQKNALDVSGGVLQSVISESGHFNLSLLNVYNTVNGEQVKSRLTIDGEVIFDGSVGYTSGLRDPLIGYSQSSVPTYTENYEVKSSILFEYATNTDTSIDVVYLLRPIL